MVLAVGVGEEVAVQHRKVGRPRAGGHVIGLVHRVEVVRQGSKLGLASRQTERRELEGGTR